jgi:hypothetical protein
MIDLVGITRWRQQENQAPFAHEFLKPLEARSLLIDEGEKGSWFSHQCEDRLQCLFRVLVECGGQVRNLETPDKDWDRIPGASPR